MNLEWIRFARTDRGWLVSDGERSFPADDRLAEWFKLSRSSLFEILTACLGSQPVVDFQLVNPISPSLTPILGAGVTFESSHRERRLETFRAGSIVEADDDGRPTPYDVVYDPVNPPEVFFKALSYKHLSAPNELWIRPDGAPDGSMGSSVPEPERVLFVNSVGEIVAETIGSDTTARQLESRSPLYLPAAKTYPGSTTLNPLMTVFNPDKVHPQIEITMTIERDRTQLYRDTYSSGQMKRTPESLVRHARTLADEPDGTFRCGFALFTGTGIVPPVEFSLQEGDLVSIESPQLGAIKATTRVVKYEF